MEHREVIVVGGGFAGVTAARELSRSGRDVVLVEARERLGGRTWTEPFEGQQVELGGTWIHWSQPHVWSEVGRYGLEVVETPGAVPDRMVTLVDGRPQEVDEDLLTEVVGAFDALFAPAQELWPRPYDAAFSLEAIERHDSDSKAGGATVAERIAALELRPAAAALVTGFLETLAHTPAHQASFVELARVWSLAGSTYPLFADSVGRYKLRHGTRSLLEAMVADGRFEVRLSSPVTRIKHQPAGVEVTLAGGEVIAAPAAVVALPMNVVDRVEFEPPLGEVRREAAARRHAGQGAKVLFAVRGDLGSLMCLATAEDAPLGAVFTYASMPERTLLVAFAARSADVDLGDTGELQEALRRFLPDAEVLSTTGHHWSDDPFSQGTWCTYRPGDVARLVSALDQDEGELVFAGGDYGNGWRGFIDGAIGSGARAAQRINGRLGTESAGSA